jgi:hypothetical protein
VHDTATHVAPEHPTSATSAVGHGEQAPPQRRVSGTHWVPHATPSHVAISFGPGAGHGEHALPHVWRESLVTH